MAEFDPSTARPIGDFDPTTAKPLDGPGVIGRARDAAITAAKGVIGVPEAAVGIADIVSGGRAGKALDDVGVSFKRAKDYLSEQYTPEQKAAFREVQDADGFLPTISAAVQNPSTILHAAGESLPAMFGGGAIARGVLAAAPKMAPALAAGLGEGAITAGMGAEAIRQETPDGLLTPEQSALGAASGVVTAGISRLSGGIANKLGITDVDVAIAKGGLAAAGKKGLARRVGEGVVTEGLLEEAPQSYQEQVMQNLALGKPWDEGAAEAAGMGALVGGLMGGGANVFTSTPEAPPPVKPPLLALPAPGDANASAPMTPPAMSPDPGLFKPSEDLAHQSAIDHAASVYAARAAEEERLASVKQAAPGAPLALPSPEDANAHTPMTPPALDPGQGPFKPSEDLSRQTAADRAASLQAARDAEEDRRIAAFAAQGPLSAAAASSMASGAHQASRAGRAGEINPPADTMAMPVPISDDAKALNKELQIRLAKAPSMSLQEAQAKREALAARDRKAVVLPHPDGGFTVAPASFVAPEVQRKFKTLQKGGALPGPDSNIPGQYTVDSQGVARPSTYGEQNVAQRQAFAEMRRQHDTPKQPPIATSEQAKARADDLTMKTGVEHEVVPHPVSSTGFAVRPVPATVEGGVTEKSVALSPTKAEPKEPKKGADVPKQGTPAPVSDIDRAAHAAATSLHNDSPQPTAAQAEAGNYKKGHVKLHGLDITVENPAGSVRVDTKGEWANYQPHHYGYIKGTKGKDGDQIDVTIGDGDKAFVIDQIDPATGKLDEHKVMLNFASKEAAEKAYRAAYPADWQGFGRIREMDIPALKRWLKQGDNPKPDLSAQALDGLKISMPIEVAETGEVVQVKQDARESLVGARSRVRKLEQLLKCIG